MKQFISYFVTIIIMLLSLNFFVSCAMRPIKMIKPIKVIKPVYVPISTKRLKCIHNFLNRDIEIIKANNVCNDIFETK